MARSQLDIIINGRDNASGAFGAVAGSLGSVLSIAAGNVLSASIGTLTRGLGSAAQMAFEATAAYESLSMSLQSLVAREIVAAGEAQNMQAALGLATEQTEALLAATQQMAITSPFGQQDIAAMFQMAVVMGSTTDEAMELTNIITDTATAMGLSGAQGVELVQILGQISGAGQLLTQDLRQLQQRGIPATQILEQAFGQSLDEIQRAIEAGEITIDQATDAIVNSLENDFAGAAERSAETLSGLQNSLEDLRDIGLRTLFEGVFDELRPEAAALVGFLQEQGIPAMARFGEQVGSTVGNVVDLVRAVSQSIDEEGLLSTLAEFDIIPDSFYAPLQGIGDSIRGLKPDIQAAVSEIGATISDAFADVAPGIDDNLAGALGGIGLFIETNGPAIVQRVAGFVGQVVRVFAGLGALASAAINGALQMINGDMAGGFATIQAGVEGFINQVIKAFIPGETLASVRETWRQNGVMLGMIIANSIRAWQFVLATFPVVVKTIFSNAVAAVAAQVLRIPIRVAAGLASAVSAAMGFVGRFVAVGAAIVQGLINGIRNNASALIAYINTLIQAVIDTAVGGLAIGSPSRVFADIGSDVVAGFVQGLEAMQGMAINATSNMAGGATQAAEAVSPPSPPMTGGAGGNVTINVTVNSPDLISAIDEQLGDLGMPPLRTLAMGGA